MIPRCSCGAPLIRADIRGRFDGALLESCFCAADCIDPTTILLEACPHANALIDDEGGCCECLDCGHEWYQDGDATPFEIQTRRGMVRL